MYALLVVDEFSSRDCLMCHHNMILISHIFHLQPITMQQLYINKQTDEADLGTKPSSMYGLHSHSGDLVEDDIYVSDGSLESDDEDNPDETKDTEADGTEKQEIAKTKKSEPKLELVLTTSKMGLMRRGGISSLLGQPVNRTWVRSEQTTTTGGETTNEEGVAIKQEEEKEITDPALLLQIQQRKIEEAKQNARILESSENAGRDPCLFSKRTAFDIRMDQIEEKPWEKGGLGGADITDYMNYGLTEEDWIVSFSFSIVASLCLCILCCSLVLTYAGICRTSIGS